MFTPPAEIGAALAAFILLFTQPFWVRARGLLCGMLLVPASTMLTAAWRALGLAQDARFQNAHRLFNRAR